MVVQKAPPIEPRIGRYDMCHDAAICNGGKPWKTVLHYIIQRRTCLLRNATAAYYTVVQLLSTKMQGKSDREAIGF